MSARVRSLRLAGENVVAAVWAMVMVGILGLASQAGWTDWDSAPLADQEPVLGHKQQGHASALNPANGGSEEGVGLDTGWVQVSAVWECRDVNSDLQCRPVYELENVGVVALPPPPSLNAVNVKTKTKRRP